MSATAASKKVIKSVVLLVTDPAILTIPRSLYPQVETSISKAGLGVGDDVGNVVAVGKGGGAWLPQAETMPVSTIAAIVTGLRLFTLLPFLSPIEVRVRR